MKKVAVFILLLVVCLSTIFFFTACIHTLESVDEKPSSSESLFMEKVTGEESLQSELPAEFLPNPEAQPDSVLTAGGLILTFDDFSFSWLDVIPLLRKYNAHATFYISLSELDEENVTVLEELQRAGHEIGWHTRTHPDMRKIPLSDRQNSINGEILIPVRELSEKLHTEIGAFAYPYGFYDEDWEMRLSEVFTSTRGFGRDPEFYSSEDLIERNCLKAASLDNLFFIDSEQRSSSFHVFCQSVMDKVSESDHYTILGSHGMDSEDWGIKRENLVYLLSEAAHKDISVLSMKEAFSQ